jgi:hypothetical protein
VSLSAIRYNSNSLTLTRVGRRGQRKKEKRRKERKEERKKEKSQYALTVSKSEINVVRQALQMAAFKA